ncbi:uncharacterized protein VTP21DRAFT_6690 [Calcarisporiella thermophila]|uniref:uncharacterized protein n=1 Tax=Calcarisporiella thermophila TaxID=911321 RepID=UPI003742AF33
MFIAILLLPLLATLCTAADIAVWSKKNFKGTQWNGIPGNSLYNGVFPEESYGKQFSVKALGSWSCTVTDWNGFSRCVDREGWGNIATWPSLKFYHCHPDVRC